MTPDPEQRLPRELLKELIEEGSDAFRGVLEKLLNTAMLEREEFPRRWERSEQRRDVSVVVSASEGAARLSPNRVDPAKVTARLKQLCGMGCQRLVIRRRPQVGIWGALRNVYPQAWSSAAAIGVKPAGQAPQGSAQAEMYVILRQIPYAETRQEALRFRRSFSTGAGTEISASQVSRISKLLDDELEQFRNRPLGSYPVVYLDAHYEKVRRQGSIQDVAVLKATGRWGKREVIGVSCRLRRRRSTGESFCSSFKSRSGGCAADCQR